MKTRRKHYSLRSRPQRQTVSDFSNFPVELQTYIKKQIELCDQQKVKNKEFSDGKSKNKRRKSAFQKWYERNHETMTYKSGGDVANRRIKQKKRYHSQPGVAERKRQQMKEAYTKSKNKSKDQFKNQEVAEKKKGQTKELKKIKKEYFQNMKTMSQKETDKNIIIFRKKCREFPVYICCICGKLLFKKQVLSWSSNRYRKCENIKKCVQNVPKTKNKNWICNTCNVFLKKDKIPPQAMVNNMELLALPNELKYLNILEKHLISPVIPFMKIVTLPKGLQKGIHGPVICVQSDIQKITNILPRSLSEETLLKVKLKRKLAYRGHHLYQQISVSKVLEALQYLKKHNPIYENVQIDSLWPNCDNEFGLVVENEENLNSEKSSESLIDSSNTISELAVDENKEHEMNKTTAPLYSCLQPADLASHVAHSLFESNEKKCKIGPDCTKSFQQKSKQVTVTNKLDDDRSIINIAPAEGFRPLKVIENESKCFPYLFPNAANTLRQDRQSKISVKKYFTARLLHYDGRFAKDPQYIFFAQYTSEMEDVCSSIAIAMRKTSKPDSITAETLRNAENLRKLIKSDQGYKFLQNVRGSPPYWEKTMRNAFALLRQLGLPTFFVTLSAADRRWPEIIESICSQENKPVPDDLDWTTYCQLINNNVITATRMFDKRLHDFIQEIIMSESHPVGQVVDMFGRIEFQARGWPHYHGLLWIKNAPSLQEASDTEICEFIDKYICCRMPKPEESELFDIVSNVQVHSKNHSKSCKKGGKECRFNFPRPPSMKTFISKPADANHQLTKDTAVEILQHFWQTILDSPESTSIEELFEKAKLSQEILESCFDAITSKKNIILKRNPNDCWVNAYNETLLRAWNGNMDIQFVLDAYSCLMYILSYITKAERELGETIKAAQKEAREDNLDAITELRKLGSTYITHREVSLMESSYRMLSLKLRICTRDVIWLPSDPESIRLTLPLSMLQKVKSEKIFMTNLMERYWCRPQTDEFIDLCLAQFWSVYRLLPKSEVQTENEVTGRIQKQIKLRNDMGFVVKRKDRNAVIKYLRLKEKKNPERFYHNLMNLFLPIWSENILPKPFTSYEAYFARGNLKLSTGTSRVMDIVRTNMNQFEKLSVELDETWSEMQKTEVLEDAWAQIAPLAEIERNESEAEKAVLNEGFTEEVQEENVPELNSQSQTSTAGQSFGVFVKTLSETEMHKLKMQMNAEQQEIFNVIRKWCLAKVQGQNPKPFQYFLTGGAGTGKSHLIKCIHHEASKLLQPLIDNPDEMTVVLVAFTGTAAFNISGHTIHSTFHIWELKLPYQGLGEDQLNTLQAKLKNVQILIIDEVSMVSKNVMQYIHGRLLQIKRPFSKECLFGNVSVLAVGDFYQIPPVCQKKLFEFDPGALPADLWPHFRIHQLTEIMRQKDDQKFAQLLNRLRTRQKGAELSVEDNTILKMRILQPGDKSEQSAGMIHIFSTNKEVDSHNNSELEKLGQKVHMFKAVDTISKKGKQYRKAEAFQKMRSVFQTELRLAVGARVMLNVNLDVTDGLVNGAVGEICLISCQKNTMGFPTFIAVLFDHPNVGVNSRLRNPPPSDQPQAVLIEPFGVKEHYSAMDITRHQFPLRLAWACTIHKVQGQTFKAAVVSLKTVFLPGMAYVALSRVTSLDGLYLKDYNQDAIYADSGVQKAMDSMEPIAAIKENKIQKGSKSFMIVHHNIQSLHNHFSDMEANADLRNADIICLTETWLPKTFNMKDYELQGYNMVYDDIHQRGRGICVYLKEQVVYQLLPCHNVKGIEMFSLTFQNKAQRILLTTIYRPPQDPIIDLKEVPFFLCEIAANINADAIILIGDFNEDFHKTDCYTNTLFSSHQFQQLITEPTTSTGTTIDLIFQKNILGPTRTGVLSTYYSYHEPVYLLLSPVQIELNKDENAKKIMPSEKPTINVRKKQERKRKRKKNQDNQDIIPKKKYLLNSAQKEDQPTNSLDVEHLFAIPNVLPATDRIRIARVVDMWGASGCVYELCEWLEQLGFRVYRDISRRQRGSTCGYIAACVAWLLHSSISWLDEDVTVVGSIQEELVREYNNILDINSRSEVCLTTDQILQLLSFFQREAQEGYQMNWIDGPMPVNHFTQSIISFISEFNQPRTQPKISIVNTTPVYRVAANLAQEDISGDHWIVIAYNII